MNGKYFDGQSAVAHPVRLTIEGSSLRIDLEDRTIGRWPVSAIFRDPSHSVAIVIGCGAGDDRVEVFDPAIVAELKIKSTKWTRKDLQFMSRILVPCFAVFAVLIGLGIWHSRVVTRYLAHKIPLEQERKLLSVLQSGKQNEICELSEAQQSVLNKVVDRLYKKDPQNRANVQVSVLKLDSINAFTLPGGVIWILDPLLRDVESPDELAGVLAHEIEHVQKRHVTEAIVRATLFTGLLNAMAGDVSGILLVDPATAAQIFSLQHSREMEEEADAGALARLKAAEISPSGLGHFFERMQKRHSTPKALSFLSTHPADEDRIRKLKMDGTKPGPAIVSDAEWAELRNACTSSL